MKKNIRTFDNMDQVESVMIARAKILMGDRKVGICLNALSDYLRDARGMIQHVEGKILVDDDLIAKVARQIREDSFYHA